MRQRRLFPLLVLVLVGAASCGEEGGRPAAAPGLVVRDEGAWESVEVIHGPGVHMRLRYRKRASTLDEQWLGLEFVNTTSEPVLLRGIQLGFDYDLVGRSSGGLLQNNTSGVLPSVWSNLWNEPVALAPGATRVWGGFSEVASSRIPLAESAGDRLRIRVGGGHIQVGDGTELHNTPEGGAWVEMNWVPVDDEGIAALRERLDRLLDAPRDSTAPVERIVSWLRKPRVCSHVDASRLIAALERRRPVGVARIYMARYLGKHFGNEAVVRRHFLERLQAGDLDALTDISMTRNPYQRPSPSLIWLPEYVEAITRLIEKTPKAWTNGFSLLEAQGTPQAGDEELAERLSAAVLARRVLEEPEGHPGDTWPRYPDGLDFLARCRDAKAIPELAKKLSDLSVRRSIKGYPKVWSFNGDLLGDGWSVRPPPSRMCDFAMDAILKLEGRDLRKEYERAGFGDLGLSDPSATNEDNVRAIGEMRDRMIAALRLRLAR